MPDVWGRGPLRDVHVDPQQIGRAMRSSTFHQEETGRESRSQRCIEHVDDAAGGNGVVGVDPLGRYTDPHAAKLNHMRIVSDCLHQTAQRGLVVWHGLREVALERGVPQPERK